MGVRQGVQCTAANSSFIVSMSVFDCFMMTDVHEVGRKCDKCPLTGFGAIAIYAHQRVCGTVT